MCYQFDNYNIQFYLLPMIPAQTNENISNSFSAYFSKLKTKIPYFMLLIHFYAVNSVFSNCNNTTFISGYLIAISILAIFWESWFVVLSYYNLIGNMRLNCNCFSYMLFTCFSRFLSFAVIANFTTSGVPLKCIVPFSSEILNLIVLLFLGLNFIMDTIESYFWKPLSDLEQNLESNADQQLTDTKLQETKSKANYGTVSIFAN